MTKKLAEKSSLPLVEVDPSAFVEVVDVMLRQDAGTVMEIVDKTKLPIRVVQSILSHPEFSKRFCAIKREVAKAEFDAVAYDRLIEIIRKPEVFDERGKSSGDKNAIAAAKALAEILGKDEKKKIHEHRFSFEEIIRDRAIDITPEKKFPGFDDD